MKNINEILSEATDLGASDVYITVGVPPTFKINGKLHKYGDDKLTPDDTVVLVSSLFTRPGQFESFMHKGDGETSYSIPKKGRYRVSAYLQRGSVAASIRLVNFVLPDPVELGIPEVVLDTSKFNNGLVLVTGPAGSGKSTTLASIIDLINKNRDCHILTLEDPIEYLHSHKKSVITQREIGMDSEDYTLALRNSLRQAPDVIFIGEMRDFETISIAMTAAETGHLVFSTLHTIGSAKSIDRIVDIFPAIQQQQIRIQLSTVLQAVISQQLIPSAAKGLVPAFEIMLMNKALRNLIREGKTHQLDLMIENAQNEGMKSMDSSLIELYKNGLISKDDLLNYCIKQEVVLKQI